MRKFFVNNKEIIFYAVIALLLLKSCSDSRRLNKIEGISTYLMENIITQEEFRRELEINGLETEKRMIQSTDRKMMDVQRQVEIDKELSGLKK